MQPSVMSIGSVCKEYVVVRIWITFNGCNVAYTHQLCMLGFSTPSLLLVQEVICN